MSVHTGPVPSRICTQASRHRKILDHIHAVLDGILRFLPGHTSVTLASINAAVHLDIAPAPGVHRILLIFPRYVSPDLSVTWWVDGLQGTPRTESRASMLNLRVRKRCHGYALHNSPRRATSCTSGASIVPDHMLRLHPVSAFIILTAFGAS